MKQYQPLVLAPGRGVAQDSDSVVPHVHTWERIQEAVGFFFCPGCPTVYAVCPGCLNSLDVALKAADAGLVVLWCAAHCVSGRAGREES